MPQSCRPLLCRLLIATGFCLAGDANAQQVLMLTETSRAEYEAGTYAPGKPEFRYRLEVDEKASRARVTEIVRLRNGELIASKTEFSIVAVETGKELDAYLTSEPRRGQKVLTLVGKPGTLATEMFLVGETFFEYVKGSSSRLYLATGTIQRAKSVAEDTQQEILRQRDRK
jgi:hypothetical protein